MTILVLFPVIGSQVHFVLLPLRRLPAYAVLSEGFRRITLPINAFSFIYVIIYQSNRFCNHKICGWLTKNKTRFGSVLVILHIADDFFIIYEVLYA